ncbi:hypothetical protein FQW43_09865 [Salmonella enterica subsp. enterica serovar Enteritidis]|nr:hypothetical protein [Salmonella enterica subsp. diarizonae]ECK2140123.1 hypothetical protein [Salmonella enterica subsp. enterica serovar Enteritidis]ELP2193272.1 hypothetical protein [Salmonella enterica subsp. enterica serovar Champaign]HAF2409326.1 hypothetical protein [Salmonella enterica]ECE6270596.1 hypothetical protein [Salmonella enterica subsp. diarizonae]
MTLFIHRLVDDSFQADITCPDQKKIPPVISASPLPTVHPHGLFVPGVSLRITDTTCQSHPLQ